jgi:hypothetical protein
MNSNKKHNRGIHRGMDEFRMGYRSEGMVVCLQIPTTFSQRNYYFQLTEYTYNQ